MYDNSERVGFLKIGIALFFGLTIFEAVLNNGSGSLLKYYGLFLVLCTMVSMWLQQNTVYLRVNKVLKPFVIWFAFAAVSVFWSRDSEQGFDYILSMGNVLLMALIISTIKWMKRDIEVLFLVYGISALGFSLILLVSGEQVYSETLRYTVVIMGTRYDPNVIVGFMAPGAILLLFLMSKKFVSWLIAIPGSLVIAYAIFLSGSRGGVLALAATVAFYILAYTIKEKLSVKKIATYIIIVVAIIVCLTFLANNLDASLYQRLFHIDMTESSSVDRMNLLRNSWNFFKDNPIFGLGIGGLDAVSNNHGAHNMYMFVLCDMGIIGFILFIYSIVKLGITVWKSDNWQLTTLLVCTCAVVFFLDSYHAKYFWNTIIFLNLAAIFYNDVIVEE